MDKVTVYSDGACKGNPGPGGWGALLEFAGVERELFGGEAATTNNRMELMAVIMALRALKRPCEVQVFTDSQYVQKGITEWVKGWQKNGWRNSKREPVKNEDLWRELLKEADQHRIVWSWVKGHAGHPGNERADALANRAIEALA
jgi:ribonuclease HI